MEEDLVSGAVELEQCCSVFQPSFININRVDKIMDTHVTIMLNNSVTPQTASSETDHTVESVPVKRQI